MDPKDVVNEGKRVYGVAEGKVDGWFASNKFTIVILTAVAIALVAGAYFGLKSTFFCA